ncbi:endospore germination permease [Cohnella fermenti]|uniref:Spore gernimation protein n=1 Tax=Cohnella fermenti TaxID=2565925 RepID=A0A4S4BY75_9BACL|nr:endospore germination permease [Cohnella fermenti]THF79492.1 spore gernimation protein [Cohnella fermenti]
MEYQLIRIGRTTCLMMVIMSIGFMNHVVIAPMVLDRAGRDSWLTVLLTAAILPVAILLLRALLRSIGTRQLPEWLGERVGLPAKYAILAVFAALLGMIVISTVLDTIQWGEATYLPRTPTFVTTLIFATLCTAGAVLGIHVIAYVSCLLLPFVCLLGLFVSGANTPRKDYSELLPVLEHGWSPVLNGMVMVAGGYSELVLLVLIQGYVNKPFAQKHVWIVSAFIVVLSLGPIVGVLTEFGPYEASIQRYPAFIQWRIVQIGKYFEHVDFFAIFQWISGAYIRTSCSLALMMDLFAIRSRVKRGIFGGALGLLTLGCSIYPVDDSTEYRFYAGYAPIMLCAFAALLLLLLLIAAFGKRGDASHETSNGA